MKKTTIRITVMLAVCLVLCACGGKDAPAASSSAQTESTTESATESTTESTAEEDTDADDTDTATDDFGDDVAEEDETTDDQEEDPATDDEDEEAEEAAEPEVDYSYEGIVFTVNGKDFDIRDYCPVVNAIMDCERVGDWIIVNCHVNPHVGVYEFYNIYSESFEYEIQGVNLTWRDDDLSTAVYSMYSEIFNFWGNPIGWIEDAEIMGIEYIDDETIGAECWMIDEEGEEAVSTRAFECISNDSAVLKYYEYLLGGNSRWKNFMKTAPENSSALVMVNPPEKILEKMPQPAIKNDGALDTVIAVSLADRTKFHVNTDDTDASGKSKYNKLFYEAGRGDAVVFQLTVPEGIPHETLEVYVDDAFKASWDIGSLSGRSPQISTFITTDDL